ncbi:hypothetical protein J2W48_004456 [Flavobacterium piscis]|uniref:Secreted protein n=1 Tax=Flavobacterium piscis TaxID=1114874 RepID=A0ABU1YEI0_9FLAO|nr:hypothetical protein [Flavobacterium piscis]
MFKLIFYWSQIYSLQLCTLVYFVLASKNICHKFHKFSQLIRVIYGKKILTMFTGNSFLNKKPPDLGGYINCILFTYLYNTPLLLLNCNDVNNSDNYVI